MPYRLATALYMVRTERIELSRLCSHEHLKLACLPVPPRPHGMKKPPRGGVSPPDGFRLFYTLPRGFLPSYPPLSRFIPFTPRRYDQKSPVLIA